MVALDHIHLLEFLGFEMMEKSNFVEKYKTGSYTYLFDDEGWIIAHQKLWDIRGLDKNGSPIEPLNEHTPKWKYDAGVIPINLLNMDWRLKDINTNEPMSGIVKRVQRGETVLTTMKSMGIYGEAEGIIRTRAYAPIFYSTGEYKTHGIFGAVAVGTSLKDFTDRSVALTSLVERLDNKAKQQMIFLVFVISIGVLVFSLIIARAISKPLRNINKSFTQIAKGDYSVPEVSSSIIEIEKLSNGTINLASELKAKEKKITKYVQDLEIVNKQLDKAKKEIAVHWQHEYSIESDNILEEKIKSYESEYPKLKEVRKNLCIGNSIPFLRVLRQVVPQSQMTIPTWICGESGVGKSALAHVIHILSPRSEKPFQVFPASEFSAADPMIILGKLFGYGAGHGLIGIDKSGQKGIIEECGGGTLLIDDVDALPLESQAQILRVVDGLPFHPATGKSTNISSDVRFLFASHINLEGLVKEGLFRKDLFRRMGANFNKIEIPPLRDRKHDILLLSGHFVNNFCRKHNREFQISEAAENVLMEHDYKEGNIGELKVLLEIACENAKMEGSNMLSPKHLTIRNSTPTAIPAEKIQTSNVFNDNEQFKLNVLRKNLFHMEASEIELGFKRGSHTLSHHLRGMCLKALFSSGWEIEAAVKLITNNSNEKIDAVIRDRIKGYILNISQKSESEKVKSLYKNLPKEYHSSISKAIEHFKLI